MTRINQIGLKVTFCKLNSTYFDIATHISETSFLGLYLIFCLMFCYIFKQRYFY